MNNISYECAQRTVIFKSLLKSIAPVAQSHTACFTCWGIQRGFHFLETIDKRNYVS